MRIYLLSQETKTFPPSELAHSSGLLAVGGDLSAERLLNAYANGIFPWYMPGEMIHWWCPSNRFVIFPQRIHISKSMKRVINKGTYEIKENVDFADIIRNCKTTHGETWITDEMESAYISLFNSGYIMCVGVYEDGRLVGGLYGVAIGKCFFGESMFSAVPNASKLALIKLCEILAGEGFLFVDCQFHTKHLESMGGRFISWEEYKNLLAKGLG
jgi:leucyl/phenylalanyl-tRNA--protein transferase